MQNLLKRKEIKRIFRPMISQAEEELKDKLFRILGQIKIKPLCQFQIGKYYVDFAIPDYLLVIEYDGKIHLDEPIKDYKRHKEIEKIGWHILRIMNKGRYYLVMFDFKEVAITKYQEVAMDILAAKAKEFIVKQKEKELDWMLNFVLGKENYSENKFISFNENIESWFKEFDKKSVEFFKTERNIWTL